MGTAQEATRPGRITWLVLAYRLPANPGLGDQQPPGSLASRYGRVLVLPAVRAADGLHHGVQASCDQQRGTDPVRRLAQGPGQAAAQQQAEDGHALWVPRMLSRPMTWSIWPAS